MPSRYSSEGSVRDAEALAERLGIDLKVVPIEEAHVAFASMLSGVLSREPFGLTDENLQSRIRGVLLMAVSNARGWIVLTTGNKSELATGYSTLYGDSAGGFAVIKDVPKTLVYRLCRYRNELAGADVIPAPVLTKAPSAELRPDQRDEDSLPPYEVLDPLLEGLVDHDRTIADLVADGFDLVPEPVLSKAPSAELRPDQRDEESLPPYPVLDPVIAGYVEGDRSADDLIAEGYDPAVVGRVVELVDRAEYKRRQMPPGVRISTKAFGRDRRMPITNQYRTGPRGFASGGEDPAVV